MKIKPTIEIRVTETHAGLTVEVKSRALATRDDPNAMEIWTGGITTNMQPIRIDTRELGSRILLMLAEANGGQAFQGGNTKPAQGEGNKKGQ